MLYLLVKLLFWDLPVIDHIHTSLTFNPIDVECDFRGIGRNHLDLMHAILFLSAWVSTQIHVGSFGGTEGNFVLIIVAEKHRVDTCRNAFRSQGLLLNLIFTDMIPSKEVCPEVRKIYDIPATPENCFTS